MRDNHLTCHCDAAIVHSSLAPGNLPNKLEILSMGQTHYQTLLSHGFVTGTVVLAKGKQLRAQYDGTQCGEPN